MTLSVRTPCARPLDMSTLASFGDRVDGAAGTVCSKRVIRSEGYVNRDTALGPCTAGVFQLAHGCSHRQTVAWLDTAAVPSI